MFERIEFHPTTATKETKKLKLKSFMTFVVMSCARWFECDHSYGTARAIYDLQRRGDHDCAGQRQKIKVGQAGQSKLAMAVHDEVIAKRWIKAGGLPSVCTNGLDANSKNIPLLGEEKRRFALPAGRMRPVLVDIQILGCRFSLRPS